MMQALSLGEGAKDVGSRFPEVLRRLERTVDFCHYRPPRCEEHC